MLSRFMAVPIFVRNFASVPDILFCRNAKYRVHFICSDRKKGKWLWDIIWIGKCQLHRTKKLHREQRMYYSFRQATKKGHQDWGFLYLVIYKHYHKYSFSTKIQLRKREWLKYSTGDYVPSAMMYSQKIKYGAFAQVLSQLKSLMLDEPDFSRVPYIIFSAREAIAEYQNMNAAPQVKAEPDPIIFTDFYEQYLEDLRSGKRLKYKSTDKLADSTITGMADTLRLLRRYEDERNHRYTLEEITMTYQRQLLQWLINRGCKPNTLTGIMRKIHTVFKGAFEMELTRNNEFQRRDFVPRNEEVENVFLTPDMVRELEDLDLSSNQSLNDAILNSGLEEDRIQELLRTVRVSRRWTMIRVRDLFLLGVYTGQRFSDYSRISLKMITEYCGKKFIKLIQKKENKKVMIPLDKRIIPILNRHYGSAPEVTVQILNDTIKIIGEILGWTWEPDFDERRMGKKKGPRFCDMISSHTARRTFATNAYAAGVPLQSIMAVTGHSTEEKLRTYLKLQPQDKAMMATRDFDGYIEKYRN